MEFDFREAGSYHYRYTWGDDELYSVNDRFISIEPGSCLIFSRSLNRPIRMQEKGR